MSTAPNTTDTAEEPENDLPIDGGAPTEEEAALAKDLEEHGDDPKPEGDDGQEDPTKADEDATGADEETADEGADGAGDAGEPAAAPAPEPVPVPADDPKPEAEKDFEAEYGEIQKQFDDGELDDAEYQQQMRALSREEASHAAKVAVWEDRQQRAAEDQENAFNTAALAFQAKHADFLDNPLHVDSMNKALVLIAQQQPGLSADQLVEKAGRVTFEAYNYTPPVETRATSPNDKQRVSKATADRVPPADKVPPSVRSAPAAAELDPSRSSYSELDEADISDLEDALARLPADKVEAYLADAPGAGATGR